ncbi:uncharacterized protein LOC124266849 isoform X2 [Haliotis rubra]|uniref:uncharacterized protein LOC124266849 isoform X2 n=1 Tax=Haliotis rubra TaxID=36100 RepID=UPI001EE572F6|nr:uncharacterized protein LOC124266849 isoform X2 [Haliotis rubra]
MRKSRAFQAISGDFVLLFLIWMESSSGSTNLALLRPATASHDAGPTGPDKAVDGLNITIMDIPNGLFCTFVETLSISGWWQVDLQATVRVGSVRITPAGYAYGLPKDFQLVIYPDPKCPPNPRLCFGYTGMFQMGVAKTVACSTPVRGRFVRLMQKDPMFLCEIEVYEFENQSQGVIFIQTPEMKIDLTVPVEMETRSSMDCATLCLQLGSCPAFNFRRESRLCEISSSGNSSGLTTGNPAWDVYEQDLCLDI